MSLIRFAHDWTIENFSELYSDRITGYPYIFSEEFSSLNQSEYKFSIVLYPKGIGEYIDYLKLYLCLVSSPSNSVEVRFKYSILNQNGDKCHTQGKRLFIRKNS